MLSPIQSSEACVGSAADVRLVNGRTAAVSACAAPAAIRAIAAAIRKFIPLDYRSTAHPVALVYWPRSHATKPFPAGMNHTSHAPEA